MSEDETKPIEEKSEEIIEKKSNSSKGEEKNTINKEELEKEIQDGIRIEAKLYAPSDKYNQMEKYNLSDAEFFSLLEALPQKRKSRLILNFTKSAFDLVIFNSDAPDRKLYHHHIPMMWSPRHRGRPILGIAVEVNGKYDIVVLKLDDNKGEQFVNKVRFAFQEKMLSPPEEEEEEGEQPTKVEEEEKKEKTDVKEELHNLVDLDAEVKEQSDSLELFSKTSDWATFTTPPKNATQPDPFSPLEKRTQPDPFSMPSKPSNGDPFSMPSNPSNGDPFSMPSPKTSADPFSLPQKPPSSDLTGLFDAPNRQQPCSELGGLTSVPQGHNPFRAAWSGPGASLNLHRLPPPSKISSGAALSSPNVSLIGVSGNPSRLSPSLQVGNPFASLAPASSVNPFASSEASANNPFGPHQAPVDLFPPFLPNKSADNLDLLEDHRSTNCQKGAPASAAKFDDLLASAEPGFKPQSQAFATPRDMFAAMQQKPKSLPLNDILSQ